jgi:hypothetical protein
LNIAALVVGGGKTTLKRGSKATNGFYKVKKIEFLVMAQDLV